MVAARKLTLNPVPSDDLFSRIPVSEGALASGILLVLLLVASAASALVSFSCAAMGMISRKPMSLSYVSTPSSVLEQGGYTGSGPASGLLPLCVLSSATVPAAVRSASPLSAVLP